jgi:hypothetical protein
VPWPHFSGQKLRVCLTHTNRTGLAQIVGSDRNSQSKYWANPRDLGPSGPDAPWDSPRAIRVAVRDGLRARVPHRGLDLHLEEPRAEKSISCRLIYFKIMNMDNP